MRKFLIITLTLVVSFSMVATAFASNSYEKTDSAGAEDAWDDYIEIDVSQYKNNQAKLEEKISDSLEKSDHIKLVNFPEDETDNNTSDSAEIIKATELSAAEPKSGQGTIYYKVTGIKTLSRTYGSNYLNTGGDPGVTIGLAHAKQKDYSIIVGTTFSCPKNMIMTASWGTTAGKTITYYGTWKVPEKHNNKKVKKGYLHMRPEYSRKQYTIYSKVNGYTNWKKKGTSITKRAYGMDIYKTYTYK